MTDPIEPIARLCHEVNRIYCLSHDDFSQVAWEDAPDLLRASIRSGVLHLMGNKDAKPEDSHIEWMRSKAAAGWTYGALKSDLIKTHPRMVPYERLPKNQRLKDSLFHAIVRGMTQ